MSCNKRWWKLAALGLLGVAAPFSLNAAAQDAATLRVTVEGLGPQSPNVYVSVYAGDDDWLGESPVARAEIVPASGELSAEISLPLGEYAFSAFLDVNRNGELDSNFIGIPKEPVAVSNNARPRFGPPSYEDARFELGAEGVLQTIQLVEP
ncbi:DUF2141 domain-containing protein [Haliea sp. E17]|uniref:DUF2141 domain-containing protein n=1 Tax=Haliea sp. E17 TaxID=3401576 RepID=UPI003AB03AA6